jgi:WD40 repeat protein/ribosome biogenesis GTPase A
MTTGTTPIRASTIQAQVVIQRGVEQLLKIAEQQHLESNSELVRSLDKLRNRVATKEITLTVLGEFSSGKTTFINELLGTDLLQTGILPTTTVCTYISHGTASTCEVTLKSGATVMISPNDLAGFFVQDSRGAEVHTVRLQLSCSFLKQDLVIVDTPGVNVNIEEHEAITVRAVSESNACVYLMDARQPGKKTTIDFLRRIHGQIDKFFFVLNRADILEPDEQHEAVEFVTGVLNQECGISNPRIVPLSSKIAGLPAGNLWVEKFAAFRQHLCDFMQTERDLVICAELARLLNSGIVISEDLLQSKYRLVERELSAHYKVTLPDAADIMQALRRELEEQSAIDSKAAESDFTQLHDQVCNGLRSAVEDVIRSASTTDALVNQAPARISKAFEDHGATLQKRLSERFEQIFATRQTQVVATVTQLFSGVKWLEQRAFFSRPAPWLFILAGAILLPLIEWICGTGGLALLISPALGLSSAGLFYGMFYWARNRSSFTPPSILSLSDTGIAARAITSGSMYRQAADSPVEAPMAPMRIGHLAGRVGGHPAFAIGGAIISAGVYGFRLLMDKLSGRLGKLQDEIRAQVAPVLDEFEASSRQNGLKTIESGRESVLRSLASVADKSTERYGVILNRLVRSQRKIRKMFEARRQAISADVSRLRETRRQILSAYKDLSETLKGVSAEYLTRNSDTQEMTLGGIAEQAPNRPIDPSQNIKLLDLMTVAKEYKPTEILVFSWLGCLLASIVLLLASLHALGAFQSPPNATADPESRVPLPTPSDARTPTASVEPVAATPMSTGESLSVILDKDKVVGVDLLDGLALSSNGRWLAFSSAKKIILFDLVAGSRISDIDPGCGKDFGTVAIAFSPDNSTLVAGCGYSEFRGRLTVWNTSAWSILFSSGIQRNSITSIAFSPDGRLCASASQDNTVKIFETSRWSLVEERQFPGAVNAVTFSPNNLVAAAIALNPGNTVKVWNAGSGTEVATLTPLRPFSFNNLLFSPDGTLLTAASDEGIDIWQTSSWQHSALEARGVSSVAFSGDTLGYGQIYEKGGGIWKVDSSTPVKQVNSFWGDTNAIAVHGPSGLLVAGGKLGIAILDPTDARCAGFITRLRSTDTWVVLAPSKEFDSDGDLTPAVGFGSKAQRIEVGGAGTRKSLGLLSRIFAATDRR